MLNPSSPNVEFCGYSIPHPAEDKMHLRIQTYGTLKAHISVRMIVAHGSPGDNVHDVLEKGLNDLIDLCDIVVDKFEAARDEHHSSTGNA